MAQIAFLQELGYDRLRVVKTQPNPSRWHDFCAQYKLSWNSTQFDKSLVHQVPTTSGIYCFHIGHNLMCLPNFGLSLYGGITKRSLRIRFKEYIRERDNDKGREWVRQFLLVFDGELDFVWAKVDNSEIDLMKLEKDFNDAMMPPFSVKDFSAKVRAERNAWQ